MMCYCGPTVLAYPGDSESSCIADGRYLTRLTVSSIVGDKSGPNFRTPDIAHPPGDRLGITCRPGVLPITLWRRPIWVLQAQKPVTSHAALIQPQVAWRGVMSGDLNSGANSG